MSRVYKLTCAQATAKTPTNMKQQKKTEISGVQLAKILKVVKPLLDKKLESAKDILNKIQDKNQII